MKRHEFSWLADNLETYVTIGGPNPNGFWHVTHENVPGQEDGKLIDDDTASAWSTVACIMCEHGATVKKRTLWYRLRRPTWIGVLTGRWACMPTTRMRNGTDEPAGNSERHHDRGLPLLRSNRSRGRLTDYHLGCASAQPFLLRGRHG